MKTPLLLVQLLLLGACSSTTPATQTTPRPAPRSSAARNNAQPAGNDPAPYAQRGIALLQQGQCAQAIAEGFDPALRIFESLYQSDEPRRVVGSRAGGASALFAISRAAVEAPGTSAIAVGPDWGDTMYLRAFCLVELQDLDGARSQLEKALRFMPNDVLYTNELAHLHHVAHQWPEALALFRQSVENADFLLRLLPPDHIIISATLLEHKLRAMRGIGFSLFEMNDLNGAADIYRQVLAINPNDRQAQAELQLINQRLGNP